MWDEVTVVSVLWVWVWVVVEESRSHSLLSHHWFHCVLLLSLVIRVVYNINGYDEVVLLVGCTIGLLLSSSRQVGLKMVVSVRSDSKNG